MNTRFLIIGAILGLLGVLGGTFGAHGLRPTLAKDQQASAEQRIELLERKQELAERWEVAVRYQMYHAAALLALGLSAMKATRLVNAAGWCFVVGVAIFSGTLYALTLTGHRWLGAITPIGGVCLIVGWVMLAIAGTRKNAMTD